MMPALRSISVNTTARRWLRPLLVACSLIACGEPDSDPQPVPPVITLHPTDAEVDLCQPAAFTARVAGSGPLEYQWLRDGIPMPGATTIALVIGRAGIADGATYSLHVSGPGGVATSRGAVLSVRDPGNPLTLAVSYLGNGLIATSSRIYWTDNAGIQTGSLDCSDDVKTLYVRGGLFGYSENPTGLALLVERVAWVDGNLGMVASIPLEGGEPIVLDRFGAPGPSFVASWDGRIYWPNATGARVYADAPLGGHSTIWAVGEPGVNTVGGIATDSSGVYVTDYAQNSLWYLDWTSQQFTVAATTTGTPFGGIAVHEGRACWTTNEPADANTTVAQVLCWSPSTGSVTELSRYEGTAYEPVFRAGTLYWTGSDPVLGGAVFVEPEPGGLVPTAIASGLRAPRAIVSVPDGLVWLEKGTLDGSVWLDGRLALMRMP